jgi:hypothetical protein
VVAKSAIAITASIIVSLFPFSYTGRIMRD